MCRILHFFDSKQLVRALKKCFRLLAPGGKLFIVSDTVYIGVYRNMIAKYEKRVQRNDSWPGEFTNVKNYLTKHDKGAPQTLHFLDTDVLTRELENSGFNIEIAQTFARPDYLVKGQLDGSECVGAVATVPPLPYPLE